MSQMLSENQDIREIEEIEKIVDCINTRIYGNAPINFINFFKQLPADNFHDYLRTLAVPALFHGFEQNVSSTEEPITQFSQRLDHFRGITEDIVENGNLKSLFEQSMEFKQQADFKSEVKEHTGNHYGSLFAAFDTYSYFEEARDLLQLRLKRNNIKLPDLNTAKLLDQGCGGGRYTVAWKLLGTKTCVGLDVSDIGLQDAKKRVEIAGITGVEYHKGSVLEMPFADEVFDIVYSNGVLHHTENWRKGISEQLRVMKAGGWGWQYLIENPGGIFWDQIEILRALMKNVNKQFAQRVMRGQGLPANRVFYMLDHVMVPINTRASYAEIEVEIKKHGGANITRLIRGCDFDRVEAIYNRSPGAREKFGVGENRIVFSKRD